VGIALSDDGMGSDDRSLRIPDKKLRRLILDVIREITRYLSKRGTMVSTQKIAEDLKFLSKEEASSKIIVSDRGLGYRLFKMLKKYILAHISQVETNLEMLEIRRSLPSMILKIVYNVYLDGICRVHGCGRAPGVTLAYIEDGFKRLLTTRKRIIRIRSMKKHTQRELKRILMINRLIDEAAKDISPKHIHALFHGGAEDKSFASPLMYSVSKKELFLKLMVALKLAISNPELLIDKNGEFR